MTNRLFSIPKILGVTLVIISVVYTAVALLLVVSSFNDVSTNFRPLRFVVALATCGYLGGFGLDASKSHLAYFSGRLEQV